MPDWISGVADANVRNKRSVSVKLQYAGGYAFNVQLGNGLLGDANYTLGELSAFRAALGNASNFGVRYQSETLVNEVAVPFVEAYDDAYGPNVTANLRFQNNDQEVFTLTIPGPLKRLFVGDGTALVTPDINADAGTGELILAEIIRDAQNLVNNSYAPANSFAFIGGERAMRSMTPSKRPDAIALVEPAGDLVQP
jgi:hypothetical protein